MIESLKKSLEADPDNPFLQGHVEALTAAKEKAEARRSAADCSGWVGRLVHDRSACADWGWIRDEAGNLIIIVKPPPMSEEDERRHRRAGTDPSQGRVDAILGAINGQNKTSQGLSLTGCNASLAPGQWWTFCGETDMGQGAPVLCERCDPKNGLRLRRPNE